MEKGFLQRRSKPPDPMKTRSGRIVARPQPPAIDDRTIFPALTVDAGGSHSKPNVSPQSPYNFEIPKQLQAIFDTFKPCDSEVVGSAAAVLEDGNQQQETVTLPSTMQSSNTQTTPMSGNNIPPHPVLTHGPPMLEISNSDQPKKAWSSLFQRKPSNAGRYITKNFSTTCVNEVLVPPIEVIEAGKVFWKDYLVGFFLDRNFPYNVVKNHLLRVWKLKGTVDMVSDKDLFFFKFSCLDDRARILESDPFIIRDKAFIVTSWSPTIDSVREQVKSIRVWVKFSNIPTMYQPLEGLDWLAGQIGSLVCFDQTTERRDRLEYAIALIEITPDKMLPTSLSVFLSPQKSGHVEVSYRWMPPICTVCTSFGHFALDCPATGQTLDTTPLSHRMPLLKPVPRTWRIKQGVTPLVVPMEPLVSSVLCDNGLDIIIEPDPIAASVVPFVPASSTSDVIHADTFITATDDLETTATIDTGSPSHGCGAALVHISTPSDIPSPVTLDVSNEFAGPMTQLLNSFVAATVNPSLPDPTSDDDFDHGEVYSISDIIPPHLFSDD